MNHLSLLLLLCCLSTGTPSGVVAGTCINTDPGIPELHDRHLYSLPLSVISRDNGGICNTIMLDMGTCLLASYIYPCWELALGVSERTDILLRAGYGRGYMGDDEVVDLYRGRVITGDLGFVIRSRKLFIRGAGFFSPYYYGTFFGFRSYRDDHGNELTLPSVMIDVRIILGDYVVMKFGSGFPEILNTGVGIKF